ncbi:uncharacterized protein LOC125885493 isoform X2 [Epinephelus fuscoguttatus]|nr:uncharacterized protein LOC125885493 isoform X2 [Epinephelus fuscoguttatus]
MAASEKHWCRLANANLCQPDTIMGPENKTRGDFKIIDSPSLFSLEKRQLTHNDSGFYRFTQVFQNQTKFHVVELQVKDKPNFLQISPVQVKPRTDKLFKITCQYSQDLQEFSKFWLCDSSECPETVRSVDDRFQSALVLTIDHVACSNIKYFQCVVKTSGSSVNSIVYRKPSYQNPVVNVELSSYLKNRKVLVNSYSQLNLICLKPDKYNREYDRISRWGSRNYDYYYHSQPKWCRVSHSGCLIVKTNVRETISSLILQICVTPNDDGTKYRCSVNTENPEVEIAVTAPPPQPVTQAVGPIKPRTTLPESSGGVEHSVGIIIVVTSIILLIIILSVTVTRCNGQKLSDRLFTRRTPLSAVDFHANMYANSVAHYYSHHRRQVPPPDEHSEGNGKGTSSSSDEEFEELPVRPKMPSTVMPEETDYIRVKPGGAAWSQNVPALLRDRDQFGTDGLPLCNDDNVPGLGRENKVGHMSKTNTDNVVTKQFEDAAQSSSGCSDKENDDEVTYTHVIIKPKHRLK